MKFLRKLEHKSIIQFRSLTSPFRTLPDFVIIGAQRAGTTSLFKYLCQHRAIIPPVRKEVNYFYYHYSRGERFYRRHFPLMFERSIRTAGRTGFMTFEASPSYIFDPRVPARMHRLLPDVKLILLLRNPVDRAYSSYQLQVSRGNESLSFEEAIKVESERIEEDYNRSLRDEDFYSRKLHRHSYLARGRYAEQIERWLAYYKLERMLIIDSEELSARPEETFTNVTKYLELDYNNEIDFGRHNTLEYPEMDRSTRIHLTEYFASYNEYLYGVIGRNFDWE